LFFWGCFGALEDETSGGGELQIALLAKALALKGHEVVIVDPFAKESFVTEEGIRLITSRIGIRDLREFGCSLIAFHLKKIFIEQHADYYYVRMRSYLHLIPIPGR